MIDVYVYDDTSVQYKYWLTSNMFATAGRIHAGCSALALDLFVTFPFKFKVMLHITSQKELEGWNNIKIRTFQPFYALFLKGTFCIGSNRAHLVE